MRVLLLNQYYAPDNAATAQILADVGADLASAGHDVRAVCSDRAYASPDRRYPGRERIDGVEVVRCRTSGFGRGTALGRITDYATFLIGAVFALVAGPRPDVVLCLSTPPMIAALGWLYARLRGAAFVYWVMDVYPDVAFELGVLRRGSPAGWALGALSRFLVRRADRVVALGRTMADRLERGSGRRSDVVHNWADGDVIRPRPVVGHPLRAEWGWDGRFVVLYSGNQGLAHEFDTVLDAAEGLAEDGDVLFAFVGGGPRRAEVEAEVRRRGLPNVEFRPYVERERLGESLTAGDVHLVTLRDGLPGLLVPSKIYGIFAAGRPTLYVGPAEGEIHDHVAAGRCGTRVAVGDVDGLVAAVRAYRDDPETVRTQGAAARATFEACYARRHGVDSIIAVLDGAIRSRSGDGAGS